MKETIKVRGETIEKAREEFIKKLGTGVFILKKTEFNPWKTEFDTGFHMADSVEEAIEMAKKKLPDSFEIKGEVRSEIKSGTNVLMPVLVKAEDDWTAKFRAEEYIKNKYFSTANYGTAKYHYNILNSEIEQKGFKGIFGVGKQENTYIVTFYIKPEIILKYALWPHILAEITYDKEIANQQFLQYCKFGSYDLKGVKRLVSQGVDINYSDEQGKNALIYSSELSDKEIVEFLIEKGIDIHHCDQNGRNALFYNQSHIGRILIEKGIDYQKLDNSGDNILTYKLRKAGDLNRFDDDIDKFLRENGMEEDKNIVNELAEESKTWCPNCKKKVNTTTESNTIHGHGDYTVDEVNVYCESCGKKLDSYTWQSW